MTYYGQFDTDLHIEKYFPKDYIGKCIEVGASDGITGSNTLFFEQKGWDCISVEPNRLLFNEMKKIRKKPVNVACGNENVDDYPFTVFTWHTGQQAAVSSLIPDKRLIESHRLVIKSSEVYNVNVRTLDTILEAYPEFNKIDFVSIDTENTELDVLKGFDLNKWKPKLLVIEDNFNEPFIEEYLKSFGYKKVDRRVVNDFYLYQE